MIELSVREKVRLYLYPFGYNTQVWPTDGQTDVQMDTGRRLVYRVYA